ncbi:hypothetical protein GLV94_18650 [Virgibacillus halodenitrificans]|uniref:hypothetical protein n=1 Tax=Virgibacillus halodenitrificans TaxID=1482 RepID=UPI00136CD6F0|nr:hypothetical protein [Virgibacillus halodenitrificans]MYL47663.1 hypothetical protein [Virgibacillus halodenitrificans]
MFDIIISITSIIVGIVGTLVTIGALRKSKKIKYKIENNLAYLVSNGDLSKDFHYSFEIINTGYSAFTVESANILDKKSKQKMISKEQLEFSNLYPELRLPRRIDKNEKARVLIPNRYVEFMLDKIYHIKDQYPDQLEIVFVTANNKNCKKAFNVVK